MNIWATLGIEPTTEIKRIKRAYARKLKECHPEENPDGFQQLRQSYEAALDEAKLLAEPDAKPDLSERERERLRSPEQSAAQPGPESPVTLFMLRCQSTYADIAKRIEPDIWQELLDDELFWPIETRERIGQELFGFLLGHPFLPKQVLHLLDGHFEWTLSERRLQDQYGQTEVSLLLERFNTFWELRYDRLETDEPYDYDAFLRFREQAHYALVLNDLELAEKALKGAAQLNNREPDCLRLIALFYLRQDQAESALQVLDQWLKEEPDEPEVRLMRGDARLRRQEWAEALAEYEALLALLPGSIHALSGIAACREALGQSWAAKKAYEELCARYPEDLDAQIRLLMLNDKLAGEMKTEDGAELRGLHTLAELYLDTGRERECAELLLETERTQDLGADLNFLLGKALGKLERYPESEERLNRAVHSTEDQPLKQADILKLRGLIRIALERFDDARSDLKRVLTLKPSDPEALYRFGESLRMQGQYEEALQLLNHALELSAQWYYHSARGDCFYSLKRYPEALLDYLRVIQYDRTLTEAWFRAGYCFLRIGDYAHALEYLGEAKGRGFPEAIDLLIAEVHFRAGDFVRAASIVERYNDERPNDYYGRVIEGDLYRAEGKSEEALERYLGAARIAPSEYLPIRLVSEMLLRLDRPGDTEKSLKLLAEHYPKRGWAYLQLIRLLALQERWEEAESAIVRYTDRVDANEQEPLVLLYGGYILFRLAQYEQAAEFFEAACKVGLRREAEEYLIRCCAALGRYEQAEALIAEALAADPDRPELAEIGRVLERRSARKWKLLRRSRDLELPAPTKPPVLPETSGEPLPDIHGF
ncbi:MULTISPECIES: J domain-containing protein [Saccharibacillus]|uniref:J domain-containing protein n=1 Tax=Saccharibacillus TaxID=456492 RepID=UPI00123B01BD|nr:tetratricopeptide repeat protein [Saccharibacillus sp. WB 17]MWJ33951.1 tetratricopeptide repeat protein [Saccharibacillus sp. WB 17]